LKQFRPNFWSSLADELVRIFGRLELVRIDDVERGTLTCPRGLVDGTAGGDAAGVVVVEAEGDGLDPEPLEALECVRGGSCPAESGNVLDSVGAELMEIEDAFDEHKFSPVICLASNEIGEAVGRQICSAGAAEVEVLRVGACVVVERARPERADSAVFGPPGAAESSWPA
jgi:hypothetical protein